MLDRALTVSELTGGIKSLLEETLGRVLVQGEVSNLARPGSGHLYFNLKDDRAQLACVIFRSTAQRIRFLLENGLEVLLHGRITVYEPRGNYQLIVDRAEPLGSGALQLAFEQMKARLAAEGLFDDDRKQPLPFLPRGIGIVTSPTGAAIRDILNVLERRFPAVPVLINPVSVQGEAAAAEIAAAIRQFQALAEIDLLIVGRGGGSIEDLWAFNEEIVARAIAGSRIPVLSAVGHETDFTIADFVADLRAPTPSAAAELAVPLHSELQDRVRKAGARLVSGIRNRIQYGGESLLHYRNRLRSPEWVIQHHMQRVDEFAARLSGLISRRLQLAGSRLENIHQQLLYHSPRSRLEKEAGRLRELRQQLIQQTRLTLEKNQNRLQRTAHVLNTASPLAVMNRGYAVVSDSEGQRLASVVKLKPHDPLSIRFADGSAEARVETVSPSETDSRPEKVP